MGLSGRSDLSGPRWYMVWKGHGLMCPSGVTENLRHVRGPERLSVIETMRWRWALPLQMTTKLKIALLSLAVASAMILANVTPNTESVKINDETNTQEINKNTEQGAPGRDGSQEASTSSIEIWVRGLVRYECEGCPPNYRRVDTNGYYSYGCLQFQRRTFITEAKRFDLLPDAEEAELMNHIYSCDFQQLLAKKMIERNYGDWRHWFYSVIVRGYGKPPA